MIQFIKDYTVLVIVFAASLIGLTYVGYTMYPVWLDMEREGIQQSNEYVETKRSELLDIEASYHRLVAEIARTDNSEVAQALEGQRLSLLQQMREEVARIDSTEVPASVLQLLRENN